MNRPISILKFRRAIEKLPAGRPRRVEGIWYLTQKEHWLGWLGSYHGQGGYNRQPHARHDAAYAYNHIVNHQMLEWLIKAIGIRRSAVVAALHATRRARTLMAKSAAIRKHVHWADVAKALWVPAPLARSKPPQRISHKAGAVRTTISKRSFSVRALRRAIAILPSDRPQVTPGKWYRSQHEHWLGWLRDYDGPGAYGRHPHAKRDARFAYNHIVEPRMLLWLIQACGVTASKVRAARVATRQARSMMQQSAAIRRLVPWDDVEERLREVVQPARRRS